MTPALLLDTILIVTSTSNVFHGFTFQSALNVATSYDFPGADSTFLQGINTPVLLLDPI